MALTPLSDLTDYKLVDAAQDVRGWTVTDREGRELGRVEEMIVDTEAERVVTLRLDAGGAVPVRAVTLGNEVVVLEEEGEALEPAPATADQGAVRLPVVEEQLRVGKAQVDQGGVRVSTVVSERSVEEQVRLREEVVEVERRPVDRPVGAALAAALRDRTVEVRGRAEIPVVAKGARVVEEVVVRKDVAERTETVRDTVRRKDVDVEPLGPGETPRKQ